MKMSNRRTKRPRKQPQRNYWGTGAAGVIPIAANTGRIFLAKRSASCREPLTWGMMGGAKDRSERPERTALRELAEETGYTGAVELSNACVFRDGPFEYHNFFGVVPREFTPLLNGEHDEYGWFELDELPEPLHHGVEWFLGEKSATLSRYVDFLKNRT